jgi:SP family facilitated glucose transporter-like MFS transporter 1
LFIIFPESPSSLIRKYKDEDAAVKALRKLRNSKNVDNEIEEIKFEISKDSKSNQSVTIAELFKRPEFRWPLITGLVLQLTQQLCGINAVSIDICQ